MHNQWLYYIRYAGAFFAIGGSFLLLAVAVKVGKLLGSCSANYCIVYCVSRAPLSQFIRSWVDLSFKVCEWVCEWGIGDTWPDLHFFFKYIKALSWPSHINFHQLPTHTDSDHQVPTITVQYTASSRRNAQMSQLDLVCYVATKVKNSICFESKYIYITGFSVRILMHRGFTE